MNASEGKMLLVKSKNEISMGKMILIQITLVSRYSCFPKRGKMIFNEKNDCIRRKNARGRMKQWNYYEKNDTDAGYVNSSIFLLLW